MKHLLCVILYLMLVVPTADAQPSEQRPYVVTAWGMEQGLPQSSVNDILQTQDGYIWLATFGGLVRFDGVNFTTYNRFNTPCMRSDRILRLFEDREGTLWVSSEDGLFQFKGDLCRFYSFDHVANSPSSLIVRQDGHGTIWVSVYGKSYHFDGERFVVAEIIRDPQLLAEALSDPEGVWMPVTNHLIRSIGKRVVLVNKLSDEPSNNIIDVHEYPAGSGIVYFGTSGSGIHRYIDGYIEPVGTTNLIHSSFIWKLNQDLDQQLWAVNFHGISKFNGTIFEDFVPFKESDDIVISAVTKDSEGNIWIGSSNKGLFQLKESLIQNIDRRHGLMNELMLSLTRTPDGRFLFGTNCGGVYEWKDGRATPSAINQFLPNMCIWSLFADSKGRYWFGSRVTYMTESLDKPGVFLDQAAGFPFTDVNAITEDRSGLLWFGTLSGVATYDGHEYRTFTTAEGLSHNHARAFFEDKAGRMWVGTTEGVNRIEGDVVIPISLVGVTGRNTEPYVRAILEDEDGVMWFGTYGNGLYRWENGVITNIRKEHGLFDNIVSHLIEDEYGNFWSGSNSGIFRTSRAMLNEFHRGNILKVKSESFGVRDGMNSSETNGGFQPNVIKDENGNLYFPTVSGVVVFSTRDANYSDAPPPVHIVGLATGLDPLPLNQPITLSHDHSFIEINYTALHFRDAGKIRFRYRMIGLDDRWIEVGTSRSAIFTKIPHGEYTFAVSASINGVDWNTDEATVSISVVPPYWETPWFRGILAVILLTLGPAVYATRVNQLKTEQEKQKRFTEQLIESQENERRRIAAELHDGLGQQILVIKNRAEMAQFTVSDHEKTSHHLTEIMQSAMSSISDVRSITHDLRPVHLERFGLTDSLNTLCEEVRQTANLECSYHIENIDDLIPADLQIHFYRVIQEGITNIQKHSQAENASVFVKRSDSGIRAVLWDDGIGFNPLSNTISAGLGLTGMRERMETLGGTIDFNSSPEEGTTITLKIPTSTHA